MARLSVLLPSFEENSSARAFAEARRAGHALIALAEETLSPLERYQQTTALAARSSGAYLAGSIRFLFDFAKTNFVNAERLALLPPALAFAGASAVPSFFGVSDAAPLPGEITGVAQSLITGFLAVQHAVLIVPFRFLREAAAYLVQILFLSGIVPATYIGAACVTLGCRAATSVAPSQSGRDSPLSRTFREYLSAPNLSPVERHARHQFVDYIAARQAGAERLAHLDLGHFSQRHELTALPEDLALTGKLIVRDCRRLRDLPARLSAEAVEIVNCPVTVLALDRWRASHYLVERCEHLQSLKLGGAPETLCVRACPSFREVTGARDLRKAAFYACDSLTAMPAPFDSLVELTVIGCRHFRTFPPNFRAEYIVRLENLPVLERFAEGFWVGGHILLRNCPAFQELAPDLTFGVSLTLDRCPQLSLATLPDALLRFVAVPVDRGYLPTALTTPPRGRVLIFGQEYSVAALRGLRTRIPQASNLRLAMQASVMPAGVFSPFVPDLQTEISAWQRLGLAASPQSPAWPSAQALNLTPLASAHLASFLARLNTHAAYKQPEMMATLGRILEHIRQGGPDRHTMEMLLETACERLDRPLEVTLARLIAATDPAWQWNNLRGRPLEDMLEDAECILSGGGYSTLARPLLVEAHGFRYLFEYEFFRRGWLLKPELPHTLRPLGTNDHVALARLPPAGDKHLDRGECASDRGAVFFAA